MIELFDPKIPLIFTDGTKVYDSLAKMYKRHKKGFFIMAPSGVGKTHFVKHQKQQDWLDGDNLWMATNAHPSGAWWLESVEKITEIDERCDVITAQAKQLGFWIVGASNSWLKPDAIVLPHWSTHKRYIALREHGGSYDGGAKTAQLPGVLHHRRWIARWKRQGVPCFGSVVEAAEHLAKSV